MVFEIFLKECNFVVVNFGQILCVAVVNRPELLRLGIGQIQVRSNNLLLLRANIAFQQLDILIGRPLRVLRHNSTARRRQLAYLPSSLLAPQRLNGGESQNSSPEEK